MGRLGSTFGLDKLGAQSPRLDLWLRTTWLDLRFRPTRLSYGLGRLHSTLAQTDHVEPWSGPTQLNLRPDTTRLNL